MGLDDKIENKTQEATGKAKQSIGEATDDKDLQAEGKADERTSNVKQAGEKIKDAFKK
ncbi:CsbD family protein [Actinoplanes italicus]|uniref:CsbD-like protein n=1 Tax=Actinoplanes italicus TaxID=113567 RepID=A0A2T0KIC3_9ACTN|nr:CsbD family protein [Actinoplanes italicus]PRX22997.1 CsbD-like protein [Actinoplanes italicus]